MAMSTLDKSSGEPIQISDQLPSVIASLGFRKRPDFEDIHDLDTYRLHWAICILQCARLESVTNIEFDKSFGGPFSTLLEESLESLDWTVVASATPIEDPRIDAVVESLGKGEEFLLALATAANVVDGNPGISMRDLLWMMDRIRPELNHLAVEACEFGEERIWSS